MLTIQRRHFLLARLAVIPFLLASNYSTLIPSILVFVSLARNLHFDLCGSFCNFLGRKTSRALILQMAC